MTTVDLTIEDLATEELTTEALTTEERFTVDVGVDARVTVVHVGGELDVATRTRMLAACTSGSPSAIVVDLTSLTFMDCCGYGSIVASRSAVEAGGGSLVVQGQTGQPARLLDLIERLSPSIDR